jgi:CNT family concentrative nucleoside transporter
MILRSLLGIAVLTSVLWLFSSNKRKVNWAMVGKGLLLQFVLALAVLKVPGVSWAFEKFSLVAVTLLDFTREGSTFLFGSLITETDNFGYLFAFQVLPTVIFFSAVTSLLYYYGILQRVVKAMAWVMQKTLKLSGAESLAAAGNIFIGQTEAPLLVKPYIAGMSRSELLSLMSGGMATIAGGVLAAYIGYLGGDKPHCLDSRCTTCRSHARRTALG